MSVLVMVMMQTFVLKRAVLMIFLQSCLMVGVLSTITLTMILLMTMVLLTAFLLKMLLMTELLVMNSLLLILEKGSVGGNAAAVDTVDNDLATDDTINS